MPPEDPESGFGEPYAPALLDHLTVPRNAGEIDFPDAVGRAESETCGDAVRLTFAIRDGRIASARFRCRGCPVALAAASAATGLLTGLTVAQGAALTAEAVERTLGGVPRGKIGCVDLVVRAVREALA